MFDLSRLDVTVSTIAVGILSPERSISIGKKNLESVLSRPITIGQSSNGLVVSSQRDQIEATASESKINVRDLSGRNDFSQSKIPTVLEYFIQIIEPKVIAYGVNFLITVPCILPEQWMLENILSSQVSEKTGEKLLGGAGTIILSFGNKTWTIKLAPRDDDTISVDFNAHEDVTQMPSAEKLCNELQEQFDALGQFLDKLRA